MARASSDFLQLLLELESHLSHLHTNTTSRLLIIPQTPLQPLLVSRSLFHLQRSSPQQLPTFLLYFNMSEITTRPSDLFFLLHSLLVFSSHIAASLLPHCSSRWRSPGGPGLSVNPPASEQPSTRPACQVPGRCHPR